MVLMISRLKIFLFASCLADMLLQIPLIGFAKGASKSSQGQRHSSQSGRSGKGKGNAVASGELLADAERALVSHIKCQVCEVGVQEARRFSRNHSIVDEDALSKFADNLCSLRHAGGHWIARLDIMQKSESDRASLPPEPWPWNWIATLSDLWGRVFSPRQKTVTAEDPLVIVKQERLRQCRPECIAVLKACKSVFHGKEESLVELLLKSEGVVSMRKQLCQKECSKRFDERPKLPAWVDEPFIPLDMGKYRQQEAETFGKYEGAADDDSSEDL